MAIAPTIDSSSAVSAAEHNLIATTHLTLRLLFTAAPIIAGVDKFTNLLTHWESYLNPVVLRIVPVSGSTFMSLVGVIEIAAGVIVFLKPRIGALIVAAWLIAIALQLILWGRYLDVAVRDILIAVGGAWTLARLSRATVAAPDAGVQQG